MFPADRQLWSRPGAARGRFRRAPSTARARSLANLPAGDYFLTVVPDEQVVDWQDAPRLEMLSEQAQRIMLAARRQAISHGEAMRATVRTCAWIPRVRSHFGRQPADTGSTRWTNRRTRTNRIRRDRRNRHRQRSAAGRPVRLANVVLIGAATGTLRVTSTDDAGAFAFTNLPADRYTVGASKLPYLGAVAGARRPARPGTAIALDDGQKRSDVAIRLHPADRLPERSYTEDGRPAARISVGLHQRNIEGPAQVLTPDGGPVQTDDRGQFRFFGLAPASIS